MCSRLFVSGYNGRMVEQEAPPGYFENSANYYHRRLRSGKEEYRRLAQFADSSAVPLSFHLGSLFAKRTYKNSRSTQAFPVDDVLRSLVGISYPDKKSNTYAVLYAEAMSLIRLSQFQGNNPDEWPVNLYSYEITEDILFSACADLAFERVTDFGLVHNPGLRLILIDLGCRAFRSISGSFKPEQICADVEAAFRSERAVLRLNSLVRLKLARNGMPAVW